MPELNYKKFDELIEEIRSQQEFDETLGYKVNKHNHIETDDAAEVKSKYYSSPEDIILPVVQVLALLVCWFLLLAYLIIEA